MQLLDVFTFLLLFLLADIPMGNMSSTIGLNICAITAKIKKYKYETLVKNHKLNIIKGLISRFLTESYIMHNDFILAVDVLRKYNEMKEEINKPYTSYIN